MPVTSVSGSYPEDVRDREENFGGKRLVSVYWVNHLLFCAPFCFPVDPNISLRTYVTEVIAETFGDHPEYARIDWDKAEWLLDNEPFEANLDASLEENGIHHKAILTLTTPGLDGLNGAFV